MELEILNLDLLARNWWLILLRGLAGIVVGIVTALAPGISLAAFVILVGALFPAAGALVVVPWIGAYALVTGALFTALSFRLRSYGRAVLSEPVPSAG